MYHQKIKKHLKYVFTKFCISVTFLHFVLEIFHFKVERAFKSEVFCSIFSLKILADLKTNFTKFGLSIIFHYQDITAFISLRREFLPLELFSGLPIRNKRSKSYCMFLILNKCFEAELFSRQSNGSEL